MFAIVLFTFFTIFGLTSPVINKLESDQINLIHKDFDEYYINKLSTNKKEIKDDHSKFYLMKKNLLISYINSEGDFLRNFIWVTSSLITIGVLGSFDLSMKILTSFYFLYSFNISDNINKLNNIEIDYSLNSMNYLFSDLNNIIYYKNTERMFNYDEIKRKRRI